MELNSGFVVMARDEVTLNRPEVGTGFRVIFEFCRVRLFKFALKLSSEMFTPCGGFPDLEWSSRNSWSLPDNFAVPSANGNLNSFPFRLIKVSFALIRRGQISDASIFCNSSKSAIRISPFHNPHRDQYTS